MWVDDPHFNVGYHVRHTALPGARGRGRSCGGSPGACSPSSSTARSRCGRSGSSTSVADGRFALICKTHHALVDGISGVDIMTVLFDLEPDPPEPEPGAAVGAAAAAERRGAAGRGARASGVAAPFELVRGVLAHPDQRGRRRRPRRRRAGRDGRGGDRGRAAEPAQRADRAAPALRLGRRPTWRTFKAIKDALGGTINDVVLTVVTGALRAHLFRHGRDPEGIELKAMVPISVRADAERGALGNQVAAMYAPLPVGLEDPVERFRFVHGAMAGLKESGQAVGAQAITRLADAAAPTVLDQAARLQSRQRFFNLTVTNVPGPQVPLYVMGRRLEAFYPKVPLVLNTALGIAIMSYDGRVFFGLLGDYDALADLDALAADLDAAIRELARGRGRAGQARARRGGRRSAREARPDRARDRRAWPRPRCVGADLAARRRATRARSSGTRARARSSPTAARSALGADAPPTPASPPRPAADERPAPRRAGRRATRPSSPTTSCSRRCSSATS